MSIKVSPILTQGRPKSHNPHDDKTAFLMTFQDLEITVFFSDRQSGDDDVFVGQATRSFSIQCDNIADTGIDRTVSNLLGAT